MWLEVRQLSSRIGSEEAARQAASEVQPGVASVESHLRRSIARPADSAIQWGNSSLIGDAYPGALTIWLRCHAQIRLGSGIAFRIFLSDQCLILDRQRDDYIVAVLPVTRSGDGIAIGQLQRIDYA